MLSKLDNLEKILKQPRIEVYQYTSIRGYFLWPMSLN